jgi:hypothetical protein
LNNLLISSDPLVSSPRKSYHKHGISLWNEVSGDAEIPE